MIRALQRRGLNVFVRPLVALLGVAAAEIVEPVLRHMERRVGIALVYHAVALVQGHPSREIVPPHGVATLERQMRYLRRRYRVVEAGDLLEATRSRRRGERFPVAVTFDDDLASHVRLALPVLARSRTHATFFLSGASLTAPFAFWWERLQRAFDSRIADLPALVGAPPDWTTLTQLRYFVEDMGPAERDTVATRLAERLGPDPVAAGLRETDVQRLVRSGMTVGFHTLTHDTMPPLPDAALAEALRAGRERLEQVVGYPLELIAYPHGRADARVASAARGAGFNTGFTVEDVPTRPESDPMRLGRITPSYRSAGHFALQLVLQLLSRERSSTRRDP